jgi:hypothetical protein
LDRSVFSMDGAFLRRWETSYISIEQVVCHYGDEKIGEVTWESTYKRINELLERLGYEEDRRIGPYFLSKNELTVEALKNKLITYVWDVVAAEDRASIFKGKTLGANFTIIDKMQSLDELLVK